MNATRPDPPPTLARWRAFLPPPRLVRADAGPGDRASAVERHIPAIMRIAGALTLTMVYAAIAPDAAHLSTFGEPLEGEAARLVVRSWGALIALVGGMLLYAAGRPALRPLALTVAATSKAIFVGLVLAEGSRYLGHQAGVAVVVDAAFVAIFAACLARAGRDAR
jgi:hypothetical protein